MRKQVSSIVHFVGSGLVQFIFIIAFIYLAVGLINAYDPMGVIILVSLLGFWALFYFASFHQFRTVSFTDEGVFLRRIWTVKRINFDDVVGVRPKSSILKNGLQVLEYINSGMTISTIEFQPSLLNKDNYEEFLAKVNKTETHGKKDYYF